MTRSETLYTKSMVLFGLTSLSTEHLMVCKALTIASTVGCTIHGVIVDAVVASCHERTRLALAEAIRHQRRPDGNEIFQLKTKIKTAPKNIIRAQVVVPEPSVWRQPTPTNETRRFKGEAFGAWMEQPQFAHTRTWTLLTEPEGIGCCSELDMFQAEAVEAIVRNSSARVSGRGGVGKTDLIKRLQAAFEALNYRVDVVAATHIQAFAAGGETLLSDLHRNMFRCKQRTVIVGELSMISMAMRTDIALGALLGNVYVVVGDEGQCPPIGEDLVRWKHLPTSDPIHDLTNGLHVQLRKVRHRRATSSGFEAADHPTVDLQARCIHSSTTTKAHSSQMQSTEHEHATPIEDRTPKRT